MNRHEKKRDDRFDFEKLVVYQKALAFRGLIQPLVSNPPRKAADLLDHLDRATDSILLNVPEGNGYPRFSGNRRKHFRIALASAKEGASALVALDAKGFIEGVLYDRGRALLLEVVRMLSAMTSP